MRVYISGPITGMDDYRERFALAERHLLATPFVVDVVNPTNVKACGQVASTWEHFDLPLCSDRESFPEQTILESGHTWECYMRYDLSDMLLRCDTIAMLEGWQHSRGARLEKDVATALGYRRIWQNAEGGFDK